MKVHVEARTVKGHLRGVSEDRLWLSEAHHCLAVIDGCGARGLVADLLAQAMSVALRDPQAACTAHDVLGGIRDAERVFAAESSAQPSLVGAGASFAIAWCDDSAATWQFCQVGDCRVYLLRNGRLSQLSADDTWISEQIRIGAISAAEAIAHRLRNVITRALGGAALHITFQAVTVALGDRIVLCTDGVWRCTSDEVIERSCSRPTLEEAWQALRTDPHSNVGVPDDCTLGFLSVVGGGAA